MKLENYMKLEQCRGSLILPVPPLPLAPPPALGVLFPVAGGASATSERPHPAHGRAGLRVDAGADVLEGVQLEAFSGGARGGNRDIRENGTLRCVRASVCALFVFFCCCLCVR